jgi:hypothetical protein
MRSRFSPSHWGGKQADRETRDRISPGEVETPRGRVQPSDSHGQCYARSARRLAPRESDQGRAPQRHLDEQAGASSPVPFPAIEQCDAPAARANAERDRERRADPQPVERGGAEHAVGVETKLEPDRRERQRGFRGSAQRPPTRAGLAVHGDIEPLDNRLERHRARRALAERCPGRLLERAQTADLLQGEGKRERARAGFDRDAVTR